MKTSNDKTHRTITYTKRKKNYGLGKSLEWATYIVLLMMFDAGHYGTVFTHRRRFQIFVTFLTKNFAIKDARKIEKVHVDSFADHLRQQVDTQTIRVAYGQNLLSTVNTVLIGFRRKRDLYISPSKAVGKRTAIRTEVPQGSWPEVHLAINLMQNENNQRGAAFTLLIRAFGLRVRESALADLTRWKTEARKLGKINVIDGTKGGRKVTVHSEA